jgi:hypothetical protein
MHSMRGCSADVQSLAVPHPVEVLAHVRNSLLAQDIKTGTGEYLTPHPLIPAMVDVMAAHHDPLDRDGWHHLNHQALHGWEIVDDLEAALEQFRAIAMDLGK